jgi:hypothetical protein
MSSFISRAVNNLVAAVGGMSNPPMATTKAEQQPEVANGTVELDNSGDGPLKVPGFNGLPIEYIPKADIDKSHFWKRDDENPDNWPFFQHGANSWHGQRLTVRELARKC